MKKITVQCLKDAHGLDTGTGTASTACGVDGPPRVQAPLGPVPGSFIRNIML